jgi:hypothetical protein
MRRRPEGPAHAAQRDRVRALIAAHELGPYESLIMAALRPAIGLRTRLPLPDDTAIGAMRFGGEPDLPPAMAWPVGPDGPVLFLAQLRLDLLAPHDLDGRLPPAGLLSIFVASGGWPAHFCWFDDLGALARRPWPAEVATFLAAGADPMRAAGVEIEPQLQLPGAITWPADGPISPRDADARYWEVTNARSGDLRPVSQPVVGGYGLVPGSPAVHLVLGYVDDQVEQYADVSTSEAIDPAHEVLLAFDSDDLVGMQFGDCQRVWLLIDRAALAAGDFTAVRCAL